MRPCRPQARQRADDLADTGQRARADARLRTSVGDQGRDAKAHAKLGGLGRRALASGCGRQWVAALQRPNPSTSARPALWCDHTMPLSPAQRAKAK